MMDNVTPRIAQADAPPTDPPHELMAVIVDLQARLTKLEARDTRGLLGKLSQPETCIFVTCTPHIRDLAGRGWNETALRTFQERICPQPRNLKVA